MAEKLNKKQKRKNKKEQEVKVDMVGNDGSMTLIDHAEIKTNHLDYWAIHEWCSIMNSHRIHIETQQKKALADNAPFDSVYFSANKNRWVVVDDLKNEELKKRIKDKKPNA